MRENVTKQSRQEVLDEINETILNNCRQMIEAVDRDGWESAEKRASSLHTRIEFLNILFRRREVIMNSKRDK